MRSKWAAIKIFETHPTTSRFLDKAACTDGDRISHRKRSIGLESDHSQDDVMIVRLNFAKMEEPEFRSFKEIIEEALSGIRLHLMPGSSPSPGNDEVLLAEEESLIRVGMAA